MERHRPADRLRDRAQLVDPVAMVAVVVGDDHAAELADLGGKQLRAKVGPAVDQHPFAVAFDQDRGAQPVVARLGGVALAPVIADPRHAGRSPAAEDADFHLPTFTAARG